MLKLIKYEFRKQLITMIGMLCIIGIAQIAFMGCCLAGKTAYAALIAILLFIIDMVCFFMVFVLGIMAYSKEISGRSGFMAFMTPNSALSIILSKLIYASILATIVAVFSVLFITIDVNMLTNAEGEYVNYFEMIKFMLSTFGISLHQVILSIIGYAIMSLISFLANITVAYLSCTLSATLLSNSKARGFISVIFYFGISGVLSYIGLLLPQPNIDQTFYQMIITMIPSACINIIIIIACIAGCSYLLKRKVSL